MSYPSHFRLCRHCGGVSEARRDWMTGRELRALDNCDHCRAPLTHEDDYNTRALPAAHEQHP